MHTQIVSVINGEPLTSTAVIAQGMSQKHRSVVQLLRRYADQLATMGRVQFEVAPFATRGGTQAREVAMLNERQAAFLISLMRNTDAVVEFKVALINEFYRMRDALRQRDDNLWQQMHALIAKEVESKVRASFGSHLMLERKKEIPALRERFERLESEIQPALPLH
ncbi:Rha family transcriptional regulator [Acidovorax sp. NB1]|uniref:Rha family transcriptional regulator n=1 Tax=Acidovorax sp. NB1 TaxID=1943571 RepID=UPI0010DA53C5|nr:Rha family transcriptional regulator [Acidovorax sp. NB1]GDY37687.1 hypothetical protein ACINB_35790 [Acidovorax sp. NB1]